MLRMVNHLGQNATVPYNKASYTIVPPGSILFALSEAYGASLLHRGILRVQL